MVVIGIVLALFALFIPVIRSGTIHAREAACMSNLHQLHLGLSMYKEDFESYPTQLPYQLEQSYVKSQSVFVCPLEYRDLRKENPGDAANQFYSSYAWPVADKIQWEALYNKKGTSTPEIICVVHTYLQQTEKIFIVQRVGGSIDRVPLRRLKDAGNTNEL